MSKKTKRLYRLIDYPKKGQLYGNFKSNYPYLAAHKIINSLKVSNENKFNMAKFWIREYIKLSDFFIDFILFIKSKLLTLTNTELNNILTLLYINLMFQHKLTNKKNINDIDFNKHIKSFTRLKKNELINLISILLINYYKKFNFTETNISNILEYNLNKLNNNKNKNKNLSNIIISNHHKIKIPKIFNHLLIKIYITHENKEENINENKIKRKLHFKRLKKNIKFC